VRGLTYIFVVALVLVVCSTVALLLFARAASRETEILVRSALGASRRRIVAQLFAEALVLAGVAAVVGLAVAQLTLTRWGEPYLQMAIAPNRIPFWVDLNLTPITIISALALAMLGAVLMGVMPARKITRGLGARLRAGTAGGGGVSFGGVWTAIIVTQVALTVALPAVVLLVRGESKRVKAYDAGFATRQYLGVTIGVDDESTQTLSADVRAALRAQASTSLEALRGRLQAEPGVLGVTFIDKFPGGDHDYKRVEIVSLPGAAPRWVSAASISPSYFDVLQSPVRAGRGFAAADLSPDAHVVIVDQAFVDSVMSGRNPIGHRLRLTTSSKPDSNAAQLPWYEIIGVVKDLGMESAAMPQRWPGLYLPVVPGSAGDIKMIVHSRGDPLAMAPRVRELATAVDPTLRIEQVVRLDQVPTQSVWLIDLWMQIIIGLTAVALVLSLAGIYAVLAYIVARRTREIGVRVALGASARRVILSIFRRPLTQVTMGVMAGAVLIALAAAVAGNTEQFRGTDVGALTPGEMALLCVYAIVMLGVCTFACVVPTVRALRVQPTEALRAE
jgi:predicted permease